jgi:hypothetical protein
VLSVNWGTWEVMRLASVESQRSYRAGGLGPMPISQALDALAVLTNGIDAQQMVARIDWSVLKPLHEARRLRPLLSLVGGAVPARPAGSVRPTTSLAERLASASADMREEILRDFVCNEVAAVLGLEAGAQVPFELGLFEMGMDSLMSVNLKRRLERGVGQALPSTLTFNYPSIKALVAFLVREVADVSPDGGPGTDTAEWRAVEATRADVDYLSDAEVEARLLARLEETR